jgi:metal-responsive CopG/Arc/MetJ family transcriptional regulator
METIQVVLDSELLGAANAAAKRARVNRSSLIREALREHLKRLRAGEVEDRDRRGYRRRPDKAADAAAWERVASWPER